MHDSGRELRKLVVCLASLLCQLEEREREKLATSVIKGEVSMKSRALKNEIENLFSLYLLVSLKFLLLSHKIIKLYHLVSEPHLGPEFLTFQDPDITLNSFFFFDQVASTSTRSSFLQSNTIVLSIRLLVCIPNNQAQTQSFRIYYF